MRERPVTYRFLAVAVILFAFLLRMYRFPELPPGLFFDEAFNILDGLAVLRDATYPAFFAGNNGREPFFIYFQTLFQLLGSTEPFMIRLPSVIIGTLTVALTYPLVRRLVPGEDDARRERIALLAMFFLATLQWHLNFSRTGFRAVSQPFFEALACYLFYRATFGLSRWERPGTPRQGALAGILTDVDARRPQHHYPRTVTEGYASVITGVDSDSRPDGSPSGGQGSCASAPRVDLHLRRRGEPVDESALLDADLAPTGKRSTPVYRWWTWFLLSGVAFGAALYTYLSARLLPFAIAAFVLAALLWGQPLTRRYLAGLVLTAVAAAATALPLALYYLRHPDLFIGHSKDVSLLSFGGIGTLLENAGHVLAMFNLWGDVNWRHNLPGRPVFDALTGLFFLAGVVLVAVQLCREWRKGCFARSGYLLPVTMIIVMLLPTLLSEGAPHFLRAIGILPFVVLFPAVGFDAAWRWLRDDAAWVGSIARGGVPRRPPTQANGDSEAGRQRNNDDNGFPAQSRRRILPSPNRLFRIAPYVLTLAMVFAAASTFKGYFLDWGGRHDPYYHFDARYLELTAFLKAQGPTTRLYLSPWLANHATARLYLQGRSFSSFDSDGTIVLTTKEALYAFDEWGVDIDTYQAFPAGASVPFVAEHLPDRYGTRSFGFYRLPALPGGFDATSLPGRSEQPLGTEGQPVTLGADLSLLGFSVDAGQGRHEGTHEIEAGGVVTVTVAWHATRPLQDNYTVSVRLVDKNGRRHAQIDGPAGGESHPSSYWQSDETILDRRTIPIPADLPPGDYRLGLGAYSLTTRRTLEVKVGDQPRGDQIDLAAARIEFPSPGALAAMRPPQVANAPFGPLTLLGFGFDRPAVRAGEQLDLDLYWEAKQAPGRDLAVALTLADSRGRIIAERQEPPIDGNYPTSRWKPGDALRDTHRLRVTAEALAGPTTVRVAFVDPSSGATLGETTIPGPTVADRTRVFASPAPQFTRADRFGDKIELLGLDAPGTVQNGQPVLTATSGTPLSVTLFWHSLAEIDTSYTVFVQLLDSEGKLAGQHDAPPAEGAILTSTWLPGEIVADRHAIPLRSDLPAGEYTLIAGLYNAADGKRLAVESGDFARLGTVRVTP